MPWTPFELGLWDVAEPLGEGAMGAVLAARHRRFGVQAAVKLVRFDRAGDRALRAFRDEVRAVAALDHPNVIGVYDQGEIPEAVEAATAGTIAAGLPFVVLERLAGALDDAHVRDYADLRRVLEGVLAGIAHAHAAGVVHRDLKPANVLIRRGQPATPVVSDFGVALLRGGAAEGRAAHAGTPLYMAPEQIRGAWRDLGPWTDLYALGGMAWELATGAPPFPPADVPRLLQAHLYADAPAFRPRFAVPPGLEDWLRSLLEKDWRSRPDTAGEAALGLDGLGAATLEGSGEAAFGASAGTWVTFAPDDTSTEELPPAEPLPGPRARVARVPSLPADWRGAEPRPTIDAGFALLGVRSVPFVGREAERDRLWAALRDVCERRRLGIAVVTGGSGLGKTRLARVITARAAESGAVRVLDVPPGAQDPVRQALLAWFGAGRLDADGVRARLASVAGWHGLDDGLTAQLADWLAGASLDSRDERALTAWTLRAIARVRPLVVLGDEVALAELADVGASLLDQPDLPILLLLVAGDEARGELDQGILARLSSAATVVELAPASPVEHAAFVRALAPLDPGLAHEVAELSAGNAAFATEVLLDAAARGALVRTPTGVALAEGARLGVPADQQAWLAQRLAEAWAAIGSDRSAIEVAAVLGRDVDEGEWRRACEAAGVIAADAAVEALVVRRLLRPRRGGFGFEAGVREAIERQIPGDRLATLHGACATVATGARQGRHLLRAGRPSEAIEALSWADWARHSLGELLDRVTLRAEAIDRVGLAADHPLRIRTMADRAWIDQARGRYAASEALVREALELAEGGGHRALAARAAHCLGLALRHQRRFHEARDAFERGRAHGEAADLATASVCAVGQGRIAVDLGELDVAQAVAVEGLALAERSGDPLRVAGAFHELGRVYARIDAERGAAFLRNALGRYQELGGRYQALACLNDLANLARDGHDLDEAADVYAQLAAELEWYGVAEALVPLLNIAMVRLQQRRWNDLRDALAAARSRFREGTRPLLVSAAHALSAVVAAADGDWDALDADLAAITDVSDADVRECFDCVAELAEAAGQLGRARAAREQYARLRG